MILLLVNVIATKRDVGFRECAQIKHIADQNHCFIQISANGKEGSSNSILSLMSLAIHTNSIIVLKANGGEEEKAFISIYHYLKDSTI